MLSAIATPRHAAHVLIRSACAANMFTLAHSRLHTGAPAKGPAAASSSPAAGELAEQEQAAVATAAAPSIMPIPSAWLDSQNWLTFPTPPDSGDQPQQRPEAHPGGAHPNVGLQQNSSTTAVLHEHRHVQAQQQQQLAVPPPRQPPHAAQQQAVFRRFTWQRDAFAFADRCNLATWGLGESRHQLQHPPWSSLHSISGGTTV